MIQEITLAFGILAISIGIVLVVTGIKWIGFKKESRCPFKINVVEKLYISLFFFLSGLLFLFIAFEVL